MKSRFNSIPFDTSTCKKWDPFLFGHVYCTAVGLFFSQEALNIVPDDGRKCHRTMNLPELQWDPILIQYSLIQLLVKNEIHFNSDIFIAQL